MWDKLSKRSFKSGKSGIFMCSKRKIHRFIYCSNLFYLRAWIICTIPNNIHQAISTRLRFVLEQIITDHWTDSDNTVTCRVLCVAGPHNTVWEIKASLLEEWRAWNTLFPQLNLYERVIAWLNKWYLNIRDKGEFASGKKNGKFGG